MDSQRSVLFRSSETSKRWGFMEIACKMEVEFVEATLWQCTGSLDTFQSEFLTKNSTPLFLNPF